MLLRVVQRVDPDAEPLHQECRMLCESALTRTQRPHVPQMDRDHAGARFDEAVEAQPRDGGAAATSALDDGWRTRSCVSDVRGH